MQPALAVEVMARAKINVRFRFVGEHIALQPHFCALANVLAEAYQLPLIGTVQILRPLDIEQKAVLVITKTEILAVAEVEIQPAAADTAAGTADAVVHGGR
uniref:Uncharacterized protein n=1 Tax=Marinobacter nauticus TaxID=2743 RepID=A0A455W7W9_MARNT|nr:hypothetical protein YBY_35030 [Marinobacter nauticus]